MTRPDATIAHALQQKFSMSDSRDERQASASNDALPRELLIHLARDEVADVRMQVAKHRNTPIDVLIELAQDPATWVRGGAAENPRTPTHTLRELHRDSDAAISIGIRMALANNPATPVGLLESLADDKYTRRYAAENPSLLTRSLRLLADDPSDDVRASVARNAATPLDVVEHLARDESQNVALAAMENPLISVETLQRLARHSNSWVVSSVAGHANSPVSLLRELSNLKDDDIAGGVAWLEPVRRSIARNPHTPVEILRALAGHSDSKIRAGVAVNPSSPLGLLLMLGADDVAEVRAEAAWNEHAPLSLLTRLEGDEDDVVRAHVAAGNCPELIRERLSTDPHRWVRASVARWTGRQLRHAS